MRIDLTPGQARVIREKQAALALAQAVLGAALEGVLADCGSGKITEMRLDSDPYLILEEEDTPGEGG